MGATCVQSPDRVVLPHVSWQTYQSLLKMRDLRQGTQAGENAIVKQFWQWIKKQIN
ncbi:hypothetical protein [Lyngbya confervoides]|uniref:Transposase n=1 Tax=Lyngbya confervoides BDU141951 TaxID=1574623 RepID=A0ABD4T290_9CYAN|nr:hypothetical protein [Lyngbya confervoides]MCM1982511.1 hypothetical protein [Lyngbya confervoides BDU141951]